MDAERRRAGWGITIGYGMIVGGLFVLNLEMFEQDYGRRDRWIAFAAAVLGALVCEQGVGRLAGAALLLGTVTFTGLTFALCATGPGFVRAFAVVLGPLAVARCLVDMFMPRRGDGARRVAAAVAFPVLLAAAMMLGSGRLPSAMDLSLLKTLPILGLAAVPPVRRGRRA